MENTRKEILSYIDTVSLVIVAVVLALFPLLFTSITSDAFILPKQLLLGLGVLLGVLLIGARAILERKITLRSTPFDLPVFLFTIILFVSSLLAINRYDALTAFVPVLFVALLYFVIVNTARSKQAIVILVAALLLGASVSGLLSFLSFFKLYVLPFTYTQAQSFNTYGSLLDQAIYLALVLPLAGYFIHPVFTRMFMHEKVSEDEAIFANKKVELNGKVIAFGVSFVVITLSILATVYMLLTSQKPLILPFETGFQTAFAAISQDAGRVMKSFLFGSGYGTYLADFTRFKSSAYNANPTLWSFTFFRSSSFLLELLATTGLLGILSFLFIVYRLVRERWLFLPLALAVIASAFLPFSFTLQALFFILLGVYASIRAYQNPKKYSNIELHLLTLKQGVVVTRDVEPTAEPRINTKATSALPIAFFVLLAIGVGGLSYLTGRYFLSDIAFQKSLVAASANNGQATYQGQIDAINMFPYRDTYYRVFSQVNLQLANTRALSLPQNASPSADDQQAILTLIQQAISAGRTAVTVSPQTSLNWNNLSGIYRALIGFGQNADQFSVLTNQQAIALDPTNPQQFLNLGGIYYQLGQWDLASQTFQQAIQLKPDYANAYYNLGHSFESKGDLNNAMQAYLVVRNLVATDQENTKRINDEINALQAKIGSQQANSGANQQPAPAENQQPLDVNKPPAQLPERNPQVKIPGPTLTPEPTGKATGTPTPTKTSPTPSR
jgi:tetratricopeptide (TPR) repeat protein